MIVILPFFFQVKVMIIMYNLVIYSLPRIGQSILKYSSLVLYGFIHIPYYYALDLIKNYHLHNNYLESRKESLKSINNMKNE